MTLQTPKITFMQSIRKSRPRDDKCVNDMVFLRAVEKSTNYGLADAASKAAKMRDASGLHCNKVEASSNKHSQQTYNTKEQTGSLLKSCDMFNLVFEE
eukprot:3897505-Amphidinium_carterae.1